MSCRRMAGAGHRGESARGNAGFKRVDSQAICYANHNSSISMSLTSLSKSSKRDSIYTLLRHGLDPVASLPLVPSGRKSHNSCNSEMPIGITHWAEHRRDSLRLSSYPASFWSVSSTDGAVKAGCINHERPELFIISWPRTLRRRARVIFARPVQLMDRVGLAAIEEVAVYVLCRDAVD